MKVLNFEQVFRNQAVLGDSKKYDRVRIHRKNMPDRQPKVSVILLDWSCRERFHSLDWLSKQDAARESYELIWVELYDRLRREALEKADTVITCGQKGMYHKHIGYNVSLLNSYGEIITICDSDAVYPPDFISSIIKSFYVTGSTEPRPLVLMHYELRTSSLYPENLMDTDELRDDKWHWWPLNPNAGACMSVRRQDAVRYGGFDEHDSFKGYLCGPYDLGWRLVNAGIPERWHDTTTVLWHFAHPDPVGVNELAPTIKRMWENTYPHVDLHALTAIEALVTGRLLPLLENPDIFKMRMENRRIGTMFEEKYAKMITQKGFSGRQVFRLRAFMVADMFWTVIVSAITKTVKRFAEALIGTKGIEKLKSFKCRVAMSHQKSGEMPFDRALMRTTIHAILGEKGYNRLRALKHEIKGLSGNGVVDPLVVSTYKKCNLVCYQGQVFGVPPFIRYVDFRDVRQRSHPAIAKGATAEEVKALIDRTDFSVYQPELEGCYKGYNIAKYRLRSFAIPHGYGLVDIDDNSRSLSTGVLEGYSKDEVCKLIDQQTLSVNETEEGLAVMGRVTLHDNRMITQSELAYVRQICGDIKSLTDSRESYIGQHRLDPSVFMPGGNWAGDSSNNYRSAYSKVMSCEYAVLNNLRQFSQPFSGYQLPKEFSHKPDQHVYDWMKMIRRLPKEIRVNPPKMLGEVGWNVGGTLVNHDTCLIQERMNLLYESGIISWLGRREKERGRVTIMEIGAGYGGLAYAIKRIFPRSDYFVCDLPECLLFSSLYLTLTMSNEPHHIYSADNIVKFKCCRFGFSYAANYMFDELSKNLGEVDLIINTLSFSEMSISQMNYYASHLGRMLGQSGILFEQNQDNRHMSFLYCKDKLREFFEYHETMTSGVAAQPLMGGIADIWANAPVRKIISENLKPFFVDETGVKYDYAS